MSQMRRPLARKTPAATRGWTGVRLRTLRIGTDPDAPQRLVTLPATWEDEAASALAALVPGTGLAALPQGAERWIAALAEAAVAQDDGHADLFDPRPADAGATAVILAQALLARRLCALPGLWRGERENRGVVLNLAAFVLDDATVDLPGLKALLDILGKALGQDGAGGHVLLSNLDACLAALGLDYDSAAGRHTAAALVALVTASFRNGPQTQDDAPRLREAVPLFGLAPALLAREARNLWTRRGTPGGCARALVQSGLSEPGPADALLGVEACGLSPAFGAASPMGGLRGSVLSRLAAQGLTPEAALARLLDGDAPLAVAAPGAQARMRAALSPYLDRLPEDVSVDPSPAAPVPRITATPGERGRHEDLPDRRTGFTQKVSIGGQRLFLRTGDYADGRLGEVAITPAREHPAARGLMEAFSLAVSLGLQHGTPLQAFVEAFAHGRFAPQGVVEGDPAVGYASSPLDYVFRTLADSYLQQRLADPERAATAAEAEGLLPLALPEQPQRPLQDRRDVGRRAARHGLRLVG